MRGYYAPRKGGWDTHGLPVEHEIEKALGIFDKKEIEKQIGVAEFNRRCRESVMQYIGEWEAMTRRMGYWVNLDDAYYTLDNDYIESTWHILKTIWDKGLIYQGYKVVPYDPRIGATLSSHEVAQGYREVEDPSVTVRFRLRDAPNTSFLVWTTTPWTLPANMLLAVAEDVDYARVVYHGGDGDGDGDSDSDSDGEILILARERIASVLGDDADSYRVLETVKGRDLVGMRYRRLFDYLEVPAAAGEPFRVVAPTSSPPKTAPASSTARRRTASMTWRWASARSCRSSTASVWTDASSTRSRPRPACSSRTPTRCSSACSPSASCCFAARESRTTTRSAGAPATR